MKKRIPNALTVLRILLTPIFIVLVLMPGFLSKLLAAFVFIIAVSTDYFDGYFARKHNFMSNFGKLMDPIADKCLLLAAFFIFTKLHLIAFWMFVLIFAREGVITLVRLWAMTKGKILPAEKAGKYKTVSQMVTVVFILLFLILKELPFAFPGSGSLLVSSQHLIYILMWIAVSLTLVSGILYLWQNRTFVYVS